jgi:D-serine deaminase-like pyridoxal phosphate-dependent protein
MVKRKKQLNELATPCLILEQGKLKNNLKNMADHVARLGVGLRPHAKTAKCLEIVRLALRGQPGGIAVSTLKEAEYFFNHGVTDILYAVGIAPVKLEHVARLMSQGANVTLVLDSLEQAGFVAAHGRQAGITFPVLIEIDSDGHRSGVSADDPLLLEIGRKLQQEKGAELRGVMTHAGESYNCQSVEAISRIALQERDTAVKCAERLRQAGLPCPQVSVGSTPTLWFAADLTGVSEVRAGVYMFNDLVMAGLGVCRIADIALAVLASVIGRQKDKGWLIIDAGWTALSRDRGPARQAAAYGYGLVCRVDGTPVDDLIVSAVDQEHGIISNRQGKDFNFAAFPIGSQVRILPVHACATAAMHDRYYLVNGGSEVTAVWKRINGW